MSSGEISIIREYDQELLGFVYEATKNNWEARTVFGYVISRTASKTEAEAIVRTEGLKFMKGTWQYFDDDDKEWYPCIIKNANQVNVTVIRTDSMGFQQPGSYRLVTINSPDESKLIKSE